MLIRSNVRNATLRLKVTIMKLPIQAPPVERNSAAARPGLSASSPADSAVNGPAVPGGGILPLADCVCRDTGGGQYRMFCRIGRNYYNTGRVCKP